MNEILLNLNLDLRDSTQKLISQALCCYPQILQNYYTDQKKRKDCDCNFYDGLLLKSYADILLRHFVYDDPAENLTTAQLEQIKVRAKKLIDKNCKNCKNINEVVSTACVFTGLELAFGAVTNVYSSEYGETVITVLNPANVRTTGYYYTWYWLDADDEWVFIDQTSVSYLRVTSLLADEPDLSSFKCVMECSKGDQYEIQVDRDEGEVLTNYIFYSINGSVPEFVPREDGVDIIFFEDDELRLINMNTGNTTVFEYEATSTFTTTDILEIDIDDTVENYPDFPDDGEDYSYAETISIAVTDDIGVTAYQNVSIRCIPNPLITAVNEDICYGSTSLLTCYYGSADADYGEYDSYQWYRNGIAINGATSSTYSTALGGDYYCKVSFNERELESNEVTTTVLDEYGVEIAWDDESMLFEHDDVWFAAGDATGFDLNAVGTLIYSGGLPNNTTFEWIGYTSATANLDTYTVSASDEYYVETVLPALSGGCVAESNHIEFNNQVTAYVPNVNHYSAADFLVNYGIDSVLTDVSLFQSGYADHIITKTDMGGGVTRLTVVPSPRTGFVYATEDTTEGEWYKIVTESYDYVDADGVVIQTGGLTCDVSEDGWYGYRPAANITEQIAVSDGIDLTYSHTVADTSFIVPDNIFIDLDGVTAACKVDVAGTAGYYEIWTYDVDLVDIAHIGYYNSITHEITLNLPSPVPLNGIISVTYGFSAGVGSILILVK